MKKTQMLEVGRFDVVRTADRVYALGCSIPTFRLDA